MAYMSWAPGNAVTWRARSEGAGIEGGMMRAWEPTKLTFHVFCCIGPQVTGSMWFWVDCLRKGSQARPQHWKDQVPGSRWSSKSLEQPSWSLPYAREQHCREHQGHCQQSFCNVPMHTVPSSSTVVLDIPVTHSNPMGDPQSVFCVRCCLFPYFLHFFHPLGLKTTAQFHSLPHHRHFSETVPCHPLTAWTVVSNGYWEGSFFFKDMSGFLQEQYYFMCFQDTV